jgi:hypothetical protein
MKYRLEDGIKPWWVVASMEGTLKHVHPMCPCRANWLVVKSAWANDVETTSQS